MSKISEQLIKTVMRNKRNRAGTLEPKGKGTGYLTFHIKYQMDIASPVNRLALRHGELVEIKNWVSPMYS